MSLHLHFMCSFMCVSHAFRSWFFFNCKKWSISAFCNAYVVVFFSDRDHDCIIIDCELQGPLHQCQMIFNFFLDRDNGLCALDLWREAAEKFSTRIRNESLSTLEFHSLLAVLKYHFVLIVSDNHICCQQIQKLTEFFWCHAIFCFVHKHPHEKFYQVPDTEPNKFLEKSIVISIFITLTSHGPDSLILL